MQVATMPCRDTGGVTHARAVSWSQMQRPRQKNEIFTDLQQWRQYARARAALSARHAEAAVAAMLGRRRSPEARSASYTEESRPLGRTSASAPSCTTCRRAVGTAEDRLRAPVRALVLEGLRSALVS